MTFYLRPITNRSQGQVLDQCFGDKKQSFVVMDTPLEIVFFELKLLTLEK